MKKINLFLGLFAALPLLSGCEANKVKITYGSLIDVNSYTVSSLYLLNSGDLLSKLESNETFLIAITTSSSCTCWSKTCESLATISNAHHLRFYTFVGKVTSDIEKYNVVSNSDPAVYLISKGKVKLRISATNNEDIIYTPEKLYEEISKISIAPSLMYIDESYLLSHFINGNDSGVVAYVKKDCGDCKYCLPNVYTPYFEENLDKKDYVYLFDIQYLASDPDYATKKQSYYLADTLPDSTNNPFGYGTGYVPTSQYWSNGKLMDMSVYFNDTLIQKEDGYYVDSTYYTEERKSLLNYLDGVETKVLSNLKVSNDDVITSEYGSYWSSQAAAKYHNEFLKAFLNKYIK